MDSHRPDARRAVPAPSDRRRVCPLDTSRLAAASGQAQPTGARPGAASCRDTGRVRHPHELRVAKRPRDYPRVVADSRKETVRAGYDMLADSFGDWSARVEGDPRDRFLEEFIERMPDSACVLDLGCGAGTPSTKRLAETFRVTGADISPAQIALARRNVPEATFILGDLLDLDLPDASFDGVTAFYSISHIPREDHLRLFGMVRQWLRPGGVFLASLGVGKIPDWTGDWLGVPMFFSSHNAATNLRLLAESGLEVIRAQEVSMREPEGDVTFLWVICVASGTRHPGRGYSYHAVIPAAGGTASGGTTRTAGSALDPRSPHFDQQCAADRRPLVGRGGRGGRGTGSA
jgi:SAM-dependent methyltransferase